MESNLQKSFGVHASLYGVAVSALVAWSLFSLFILRATGWAAAVDRLMLAGGLVLAALPHIFAARNRSLDHVADTFRQVLDKAVDLEAVRREHFKARTALDSAVERSEDVRAEIEGIASRIEEAFSNMKGLQQELVDRRQDLGNAKRQIAKWEDASINYYQLLERILSHEGLSEEYRVYVDKLVHDFGRFTSPLGLRLIRPNPGDLFNERDCIIQEAVESGEDVNRITRCISWGFSRSDGTVVKAMVAVPMGEAAK